MTLRTFARSYAGGALSTGMARLNARHPWSHNDHFHRWIVRHLPDQRRSALDVGCGRGELLGTLASHFDQVHGTDRDAGMRQAAARRVAQLPNASVDAQQLVELQGGYDLITMVAVLHHLDVDGSLVEAIELPNHPWFVAVQCHPEFQSKPTQAHPLFRDFIAASLKERADRTENARGGRVAVGVG